MHSAVMPPPRTWSEDLTLALQYLARHRMVLLLVLLAFNAASRPYAHFVHDTRLYTVQVLNQVENGSYSDDLFFRFGSQDNYSLFSPLMAPLVKVFGLEWSFFLVYLAGNTLLIWSLLKLVQRVVGDPVVSTVSLLYLVSNPLNFGGRYVFLVQEPFLTPRLLAVALVLWGLDEILKRRFILSLVLLILAGLLHPLMALGGWLVWGGVFLVDKLGYRNFIWLVAGMVVAGSIILAIPSLGERFFHTMDEPWREVVLGSTPFNFTSEWQLRDWINILICWLGLGAGIYFCRQVNPPLTRFYFIVGLVGVVAVLGTMAAEHLPYALLLQGQPYRALWVLKVFQVPLCFVLIARLWRSGIIFRQEMALFLGCFFMASSRDPREWAFPLFFLPFAIVLFRGLEVKPRGVDWLMRSAVVSLVLGGFAFALFKEFLIILIRPQLLEHIDGFEFLRNLVQAWGPLPWMVVVLFLLLWCQRLKVRAGRIGLAAFLGWLVANAFFFLGPTSNYVRENYTCYLPDVIFVRDYLARHRSPDGKIPTVYSCFGRIDLVWLEMKARCFYDWLQTVGALFQRETAMEGQRRALLVGAFELDRYRGMQILLDERYKEDIQRFYQRSLDSPPPTLLDLVILCQETALDYVVLKQEIPDFCAAGNGRVFIYDCHQVRAALECPDTTTMAGTRDRIPRATAASTASSSVDSSPEDNFP